MTRLRYKILQTWIAERMSHNNKSNFVASTTFGLRKSMPEKAYFGAYFLRYSKGLIPFCCLKYREILFV